MATEPTAKKQATDAHPSEGRAHTAWHILTPADAFQQLHDHLIQHHLQVTSDQEAAAPGIAKTRG